MSYTVTFGKEEEFTLTDEQEQVWLANSMFDLLDYHGQPAWVLADHLDYALKELRFAGISAPQPSAMLETIERLVALKEVAENWADTEVGVAY